LEEIVFSEDAMALPQCHGWELPKTAVSARLQVDLEVAAGGGC